MKISSWVDFHLIWQAVYSCGVIPSDWEESFILNLSKGKGEALDHGNYCGFKVIDQVMKLLEWVQDINIREMDRL